MRDHSLSITTGVAQDAHTSEPMLAAAKDGLIIFLREQVADAQWKIARAKAEIAAFEKAIVAIKKRPVKSKTKR